MGPSSRATQLMCSIPIVAPQAVCSSRTDRWLSTKQLVVVVYIKMLLLFFWNVFISVCVSTHQLGGAPCGFIHSSMGILFLSAQLLTGHVTAGRRWQHVHTEHMYGMCIEMHSLYTYEARVSIDPECSCRSTHHLNHQPSLWTLLSIFSPPHPPLSLCRVLRPPGGGSNISLGAEEEKPPARKNKMASSVFAEPEDPYANRRNNPPGTV